jgi:alkylhydroperoxidase family enzyme
VSDEPRLGRLSADDVEGRVRAIFDALLRERGTIPNLFRVAAHRPPIVETLFAHMRAVMGPGEVEEVLKELLAIRVSQLNDCEY